MKGQAVVSGASGFVGSKLVEILTDAGYRVAALGRTPHSEILEYRQKLLAKSIYISSDLSDARKLTNDLEKYYIIKKGLKILQPFLLIE